MTVLNVAEYPTVMTIANGAVQIPLGPPLVVYDISLTAGSIAGPQFNVATRLLRINADSIAGVAIGPVATVTATATGASQRFAANQTEYWGVSASGFALAAIVSST